MGIDLKVIHDKDTALRIVRDALKRQGTDVHAPDEASYQPAKKPETLCFLLAEWLTGDALVPDDIASLPKSSTALRDHTRPDGGICLGRHVDDDNPWADIVIFGDPLMPVETVGKVAHVYREHLAKPKIQIVQ